ncbi:hypothetical protein SLS62_004979 [Diatrype stigma]|uniref:Uncharacterized protein n=1 Tax=Diatrype stigma TaxID=117547 RepID=A0AAN9UQB6_9PEZI
MKCFTHLVAQTGKMASQQLRKHAHLQVKTLIARHPTSWMAFEGPSSVLYKKNYEDASRIEKAAFYESVKAETMLKNASEMVEATEANGRFQDQSTTAPSSTIKTSEKDTAMVNAKATASLPADSRYLCTTLIKIPGCSATWPCKEEGAAIIKIDTTSTAVPVIKPMKP